MTAGVLIAVVLVALALAGMGSSWARRSRRQRVWTLPPVPREPGAVLARAAGLYLATTPADRALERIVVGGLGFRARAVVEVTAGGVLVTRRGAPDLFLAADRLGGLGSATWTLDRAVERDGLTVLRWRLGDGEQAVDVDSSLRLDPGGHEAVADALAQLPANRKEAPDAGNR